MLGTALDDAGTVDQHIEPREISDQLRHCSIVAYIDRNRIAALEVGRGARGDALACRGTGDSDNCTQACKRAGNPGTDAGRAANNQHHLAGKKIQAKCGRTH